MTNLKCCFLSILMCAVSYQTFSQKEDYVWLSGYDSNVGFDSAQNSLYGTSVMNFNFTPSQISYDSLGMNWDRTNVSVCNDNGDLLFYSNGIYIANALDEKIENSDSLNYGHWFTTDPSVPMLGYRTEQGMIAVKNPSDTNQYYLLHTFVDTLPGGFNLFVKSILVTLLDMSENLGRGRVIYKNRVLLESDIGVGMVATKHANGRDWWVISQKVNTNCYYKILISPDGVNLIDSTCEGISLLSYFPRTSAFSIDGNKYAYLSYNNGLLLFDFDRCSGALSNSRFIPLPFIRDSVWLGLGLAFSPSSRFLYVGVTKLVLQYDLWAVNLAASVDTVAVYDGARNPFGSYFHTMQNGPDGKIYESCGNGEKVYHVIEYPDRKGDSCMFMQHGIILPTFSGGVPNFPNYRLGGLPGSPCDTLTSVSDIADKENLINLYPNPATDFVVIDYGFTDWSIGDVALEIINSIGQLVYQRMLPRYSGFQKIDVREYAMGVYTATIKRNGAVVAVGRFVKE